MDAMTEHCEVLVNDENKVFKCLKRFMSAKVGREFHWMYEACIDNVKCINTQGRYSFQAYLLDPHFLKTCN